MPNLNVAVLGSHGYSRELGKKGTESDVTLYNMKKGETTVTMVESSKFPEKLQSLYCAAGFADTAVLVVERLDVSFGETVVMLDCLGVEKGVIVQRNYINEDQVSCFTRGTVVKGYRYMEDDPPILREHLVSEAERLPQGEPAEAGAVAVDHYFNVRGGRRRGPRHGEDRRSTQARQALRAAHSQGAAAPLHTETRRRLPDGGEGGQGGPRVEEPVCRRP
jgi:selenocysteine-specific translation elongation factor